MELKHSSVLLNESIDGLDIKNDGTYVDCTLGGGGHSNEICAKLSRHGTLIGIDQDEYAIKRSKERLNIYNCNKIFVRDNFKNISEILESQSIDFVDGILMDLGVSSFQLDDFERGFSYNYDAPLDMRMDKRNQLSAYEVVNEYSDKELAAIIRKYGEEKFASRIASNLVNARKLKQIETTFQLAEIIKTSIPAKNRRQGPHPARRTFQAIRIEVNDEIQIIKTSILDSVKKLSVNGRISIISFHSLEDRIVKQTYKALQNPCNCPPDFPQCVCGKKSQVKIINSKPIIPSKDEILINPRSRSAKLRIAEKI